MIGLAHDDFPELRNLLLDVPFNTLFARSVIEDRVEGQVWVDRRRAPSLAHIVHPYGMSLLLAQGRLDDLDGFAKHAIGLRRAGQALWMQVHPQRIASQLDRLFDTDRASAAATPDDSWIRRYTRTNFRFDPSRYFAAREATTRLPGDCALRPMRAEEFVLPDIGVSPAKFWKNAEQFMARGGGWCSLQGGEVAAIAFTSFRLDAQLEIGVETRLQYRGRGHAQRAACALIDACLASGLEPVWSCRKENAASFHLAESLGFDPVFDGAYYHLPAIS